METYSLQSATSDLPDIFTGLIDGSYISRYLPAQRADISNRVYVLYDPASVASLNSVPVLDLGAKATQAYTGGVQVPVDTRSLAQAEFERQKHAFKQIPPLVLSQYQGQFVAAKDGIIVDHDADLASLTHRFRERYGRVPVYITRVGRTARMPTPFLR